MIKKYIKKLGIDINKFGSYLKNINISGFDIIKLEKDFYLTILLDLISQKMPELIFKGGTCLNKVYLDYFRLSEDLDFNVIYTGNRTERKNLFDGFKNKFLGIFDELGLEIISEQKRDEHRFYNISVQYKSLINNEYQSILFDIKVIKKTEVPINKQNVKSIFVDYMTELPAFDNITINCMDFEEIVAEKVRASLTRNIPAIRDFFDIWYIKSFTEVDFVAIGDLIDIKLKEVDYNYTIDGNFEVLNKQVTTDLKPVLNRKFDFDLKVIYDFIYQLRK